MEVLESMYLLKSFKRQFDVYEATSLGFKITAFPAAMAYATKGRDV